MYRIWCSPITLTVLLALWVQGKDITDIDVLASTPTRCNYEYAFDMYGANCAGLRLSKIPALRGGIEILDFSDNMLQEIQSDTFSAYTSIKLLYLSENKIYSIEKNAFAYLSNLEILDLSKNVILELPNEILQITSLRILYLSGNPLLNLKENREGQEIKKPIKAPLENLDLSDCKFKSLPDFGILPHMVLYNISNNPLTSLNVGAFSSMCKLSKVDLTGSIENIELCDLKMTISWFREQRVYFQLKDYTKLNSKEFISCPETEIPQILNITYQQCRSAYSEIQKVKTYRKTWFTIAGGLAGFLIGFVLLLYIMHRHNVAQTKKITKTTTKVLPGDKKASTVLLNDVS